MLRICLPLLLAACASTPDELWLVETRPVETTLGTPGLPTTHETWIEMLDGAGSSIDLGHFYASESGSSRLTGVIAALERAAERGVRVRFLCDEQFYDQYPETFARLAAIPGAEARRIEFADGVHHAKYMLVDDRELFVGSANFDWRSLEHIHELGVRVHSAALAAAYGDVFDRDWSTAGGGPAPGPHAPVATALPLRFGGATIQAIAVGSPAASLPPGIAWDLPRLVELIGSAQRAVHVQLLSYDAGRDDWRLADLDDALRSAAARGVTVQLALSDWCKRPGRIDRLQDLQRVPGVEIRLLSLPEHSGGFIPFSRTIHAKYLVADDERAWLGTSNWSRDYFHAGRNLGLIVEGPVFASRLTEVFTGIWTSTYAETLDPDAEYEAPRVAE